MARPRAPLVRRRGWITTAIVLTFAFARLSEATPLPPVTKRRCAPVIESLLSGEDLVEGDRTLGLLPAGMLSQEHDCPADDPCWATAHPEPHPDPPLSGAEGTGLTSTKSWGEILRLCTGGPVREPNYKGLIDLKLLYVLWAIAPASVALAYAHGGELVMHKNSTELGVLEHAESYF